MHLRTDFKQELLQLQGDLVIMEAKVQERVSSALDALIDRNPVTALNLITSQREVKVQRVQVEDSAAQMIATQQPVATDLRFITSALYLAGELERIGGYAVVIAHVALEYQDAPMVYPMLSLTRMSRVALDLLRTSFGAFIERDADKAQTVWLTDDQVHSLYDQIHRELLTHMMSDPHSINRATQLLRVAHQLESLADRAANIAERTMYLVTGQISYRTDGEPAVPEAN